MNIFLFFILPVAGLLTVQFLLYIGLQAISIYVSHSAAFPLKAAELHVSESLLLLVAESTSVPDCAATDGLSD
jgi:hypothetical protein